METLDFYKKTKSDIIGGVVEDNKLCYQKAMKTNLERLRSDIIFASDSRRTFYKKQFKKEFQKTIH